VSTLDTPHGRLGHVGLRRQVDLSQPCFICTALTTAPRRWSSIADMLRLGAYLPVTRPRSLRHRSALGDAAVTHGPSAQTASIVPKHRPRLPRRVSGTNRTPVRLTTRGQPSRRRGQTAPESGPARFVRGYAQTTTSCARPRNPTTISCVFGLTLTPSKRIVVRVARSPRRDRLARPASSWCGSYRGTR
jgi:hypothetical protein